MSKSAGFVRIFQEIIRDLTFFVLSCCRLLSSCSRCRRPRHPRSGFFRGWAASAPRAGSTQSRKRQTCWPPSRTISSEHFPALFIFSGKTVLVQLLLARAVSCLFRVSRKERGWVGAPFPKCRLPPAITDYRALPDRRLPITAGGRFY